MTEPELDPSDWLGEGVELAGRLVAYIEWLRDPPAAVLIAEDLSSILRKEWNPIDEPL